MGICFAGLGSCAGSCFATCCCKAVTKGSLTSAEAARWLLFWLQFVAGLLAVLASTADLKDRLVWPCTALGSTGFCECREGADDCFSSQLVYRVCAAAVVVFLVLLLLAAGGCIEVASRDCPLGKLIAVPTLTVGFLFLPNIVFARFASAASVAVFVFMGVQAVLLIDFAYMWNDKWTLNAIAARRNFNQNQEFAWLTAVVLMSATMLLLAMGGIGYLYATSQAPGAPLLLSATAIAGIVLLVISITGWCEHGNLLTSALVFTYLTFLSASALLVMPNVGPDEKPSKWLLLILVLVFGMLSLVDLATGAASKYSKALEETLPLTNEARGDKEVPMQMSEFMWQCGAHAVAPAYLCAALAPMSSWPSFWARVAGLAVSALLYGWILVAPKVLTNRTFL